MNNEQKTILLVEDEPLIALSEKIALEKFSYGVITADSGERAMAEIKANPDIRLILMDIDLGGKPDGIDTANAILEYRNIPIVFLTLHTEESYLNRLKETMRYGYVVKNSDPFMLKSSIEIAFELFEKNSMLERSMELLTVNEALLNQAQSLAHVGHWSWDIHGKKLTWSKEIFSIFGVDRDTFNVSAESFESTIHPDDIGTFLKKRQFMLDNEPDTEIEHRILRPTGEIRHVVEKAKVIRDASREAVFVLGTVQDITDRKLSEEKLRQSEEKYRLLMEQAADAIFIADMTGNFLDVNRKGCNMIGYSRDEILKLNIKDVIPMQEQNRIPLQIDELIAGKSITIERLLARSDGTPLQVEISARMFTPGMFAGIVRDITERKQADGEIRSLLAEKEIIIKEVHHRTKNNMNTISSLLSLQAITLEDPPAVEALKDARNRIQSMMLLYDKLYMPDGMHDISVAHYIPQLVNEIVANFPNSGSVKIETRIGDFVIPQKKMQPLGLIVNELITNIMKYAFTGMDTGTISVSAYLKGERAVFIVQDNGTGMPESVSFESTNGFGLVLIKILTVQLNGTINIERSQGTKIILEFDI